MDMRNQIKALNELTMEYEVSVQALSSEDYLTEFFDFYEVKNRGSRLIPSPDSFHDTLREVCGDDAWRCIAERSEYLFGEPKRVTVFDDAKAVIDCLEGEDGLAPFFFVFNVMFCEYESFTLCFISGTNN